MTERLYFERDDLTHCATVLRCERIDEKVQVVLDATIFHPQGGGQPADTGWIGASRVSGVFLAGDEVVHVVDLPILPGPVLVQVDAQPRQLHAVLHSAGHLIGYAGMAHGLVPVKAHHWPGESRVVFGEGLEVGAVEQSALQHEVNRLLGMGLPRIVEIDEAQRAVGFGELPAFPCGGTHVRSLAEIGRIEITAMKYKKGQLTVSYDASGIDINPASGEQEHGG